MADKHLLTFSMFSHCVLEETVPSISTYTVYAYMSANLPAIQVIESDLTDAVSRGRDVDHMGEVIRFPTVFQCVQEQPG